MMLPLELLLLTAATVAAKTDKLRLPANSPRIQYQSSKSTPEDSESESSTFSQGGGGHNIFALFWAGTY
jgi:hypothetical protein